jgi:hypothetical protein
MLLNSRWKEPVLIESYGLRITVASAEEAVNWLIHEPNRTWPVWLHAWRTCRAVHEGKLPPEKARTALVQAARETRH